MLTLTTGRLRAGGIYDLSARGDRVVNQTIFLMKKFRTSEQKMFAENLAKLFPPAPLSDNELHDTYTRLCNFPLYIKEYLRRELGWTESQFSQLVLPTLGGRNMRPTDEEIQKVRIIIKTQLSYLLRYLDISPSLVYALNNSNSTEILASSH
ncbi:hypothetical protein CLV51_10512 [Chitinophaga niastensis]|uniref:Uncharacterized protein n=2 Tax=Chitinophaga niastensis TaxID=536980 RepID=A0A2P8HEI9_CHINA|nr:hypothetical protein CLV51_10512 [Chitinophaga niastensis]